MATTKKTKRVLVLNGPNLHLLGSREPEVYGAKSLPDIMSELVAYGSERGLHIDWKQSNHEGDLVDWIGQSPGRYEGILLNPAAYTHTSVALRDALLAVPVPCVEIHLSNPAARESFRHRSLTAAACLGHVAGFGPDSYRLGLEALWMYWKQHGRTL